jgi:hypothetical protein
MLDSYWLYFIHDCFGHFCDIDRIIHIEFRHWIVKYLSWIINSLLELFFGFQFEHLMLDLKVFIGNGQCVQYYCRTCLVTITISMYFAFLVGIFCLLQVFWSLIRISSQEKTPSSFKTPIYLHVLSLRFWRHSTSGITETNLFSMGLVGETFTPFS